MREAFIQSSYLKAKTLTLIKQANDIFIEAQADGYTLTLRQLYYQFVARGWFENVKGNYKKLIEAVKQGRLNGLIDWDAIEDRIRQLQQFGQYTSPGQFANNASGWYAEDLWSDQDNYVEVWSEKDALISVVERACQQWRVPFLACRGFTSLSEMYLVGNRLAYQQSLGKSIHILHVGDHDPSGWEMTRDNETRIRLMMRDDSFEIERLALNMDQIKKFKPPPAPANEKDSRTPAYIRQFGDVVWELDALPPKALVELIASRVEQLCDVEKFELAKEIETRNRNELRFVLDDYETARNLLLYKQYEAKNE